MPKFKFYLLNVGVPFSVWPVRAIWPTSCIQASSGTQRFWAPDHPPACGHLCLLPQVPGYFLLVLRIRDVYPGSWILIFTYPGPGSRIPDAETTTTESHKFHKIKNYFIFEMPKKNCLPNFQRIKELFTQKNVTKLSKIWVWDPRSGIQALKRLRIRNTAFVWNNP
jgi:hypothetical protein